jgi:hypothetical protein
MSIPKFLLEVGMIALGLAIVWISTTPAPKPPKRKRWTR